MPAPVGISITCPRCRKRFRVHGGSGGRQFNCPTPNCGNTLIVPRPTPPEAFDLDDDEPAPLPPPRPRPAPRSRPAPDEFDELPPRRASRLPLVLGLFALLVLIGGGAGAGYWFFLRDKSTAENGGEGEPGGVVAFGPRVVHHGKLPDSIKIKRYYVLGEFRDFDGFAPPDDWPQTLPTGTEEIRIGIAFEFEPPNGTNFEVQLDTPSGPYASDRSFWLQVRGVGGFIVEREMMKKTGAFPDGQYKAKVSINGKPVADLNFAVGERLPTFQASALNATKWQQKSGLRFEFAADGTFTTIASDFAGPNGTGTKRSGRWVAKGTNFTAHVVRDGDKPRIEYRGDCVKDELRVRSRSEQRDYDKKEIAFKAELGDWNPLGILRKDDGKPPKGNPIPVEGDPKPPR